MKFKTILALVLGTGLSAGAASAQMAMSGDMAGNGHAMTGDMAHHHGPVGVTGRHVLPEGKLMLTYRFGHMEMAGNRIGTADVGPALIATTIPNRFFGLPGQPPSLRVVPTEMEMSMHMLGAMYGATDRLTLAAMLPHIRKSMTSLTFAGPAGTAVLGGNRMSSEGPGDIRFGALYEAHKAGRSNLVLGLGLSLPTGSITETGPMLSPAGAVMVRRMAYGMQLGSGTVDLHPSLTWADGHGRWNWGAQLRGTLRMGRNDEGYALGDEAALTAWASLRASDWISLSGRIEAKSAGRIDGIDPMIVMPTQGADPLNYGGETVTLFAGADISVPRGPLRGHKLGLELGLPVYQDLNGVQLKRDWSLAFVWRKAF